MKRSIYLILAFSMSAALCACGGKSSSSAAVETEPAAAAETESYEEGYSDYYDSDESDYDEYSSESESDDYWEEETGYGFTMYDVQPENSLPYSDGVAWIIYGDGAHSAAVDADGNVLFVLDFPILYRGPFSAGYAFYVTVDDSGCREFIVDKEGNVTWAADTGSNEHIVAGGDGVFVVERHTSGFDADYMEIGAVDPYGNMVCEYTHELNGVSYNEECHLVRGGTQDTYRRMSTGYQMGRLVACYMGDGLFHISSEMFYNPGEGVLAYFRDGYWPDSTSNGHFRTYHSSNDIPVATLFDTSMNMLASEPYYFWERTAQAAYGLDGKEYDYDSDCTSYGDGLFYRNHCYWDEDNQIVLHIDGYSDREMQGGAFYNDKAVLWIQGADKNKYVTVINKDGSFRFDPIRIKDGYLTIWNDYFIAEDADGNWNIYDTDGNMIHCISDDVLPYTDYARTEYGDIIEGYIIVEWGTSMKVDRILYSIENAVNDEVILPYDTGASESAAVSKDYTFISGFEIEGKWKSTGSYGFGQAQPGAIVAFDGVHCNFYSPQDTYAFYEEGGWYTLDVTGYSNGDTVSFEVKTIDEDHIDVIGGGGYTTELERVD